MSPRAYCALQCAVPAILIILDRCGGSTVYPYLRPMTRYLCAGVGVVVRILINILAGRECACVCGGWAVSNVGLAPVGQPRPD